jgi:hypothetical protein
MGKRSWTLEVILPFSLMDNCSPEPNTYCKSNMYADLNLRNFLYKLIVSWRLDLQNDLELDSATWLLSLAYHKKWATLLITSIVLNYGPQLQLWKQYKDFRGLWNGTKFALLAPIIAHKSWKKKCSVVILWSVFKHKKQRFGDMNRKVEQLWGAKEQTSNGIATVIVAASAQFFFQSVKVRSVTATTI